MGFRVDASLPAILSSDNLAQLRLTEQTHNLVALCRDERIVYLNHVGAEMLGIGQAEAALGRKFIDFFHADYREIAELGLEVFAEEASAILVKLVRADDHEVDVEMWVRPVKFGGEPALMVEARDITAHLRSAKALREREQRLEGILNTVADGIITLDAEGKVQSVNPATEAIFGFSASEIVGQNLQFIVPPPEPDEADAPTASPADWVKVLAPQSEAAGRRKDGERFPIEIAVRELRQGERLSFTGIVRDITNRKLAEERIKHLAHHDALTGLPNRHLFGDRLTEAVKRAHRRRKRLAVMFVDLDKFKPVNDTYGHAAGDDVLKTTASRIGAAVRATDTVARVGGDEFVVLLEDLDDSDKAELVGRKILDAVCQPIETSGAQVRIGASIGIAIFPEHAADVAGLLHCADEAMYDVKAAGRNALRFYAPKPN